MKYLYLRIPRKPGDMGITPAEQFIEVDDENWESRVVDIMHDGTVCYASADVEFGRDGLSDQPWILPHEHPMSLEGAVYHEISRDEFEQVWRKALTEYPPERPRRT
jgi:hypothetical protein